MKERKYCLAVIAWIKYLSLKIRDRPGNYIDLQLGDLRWGKIERVTTRRKLESMTPVVTGFRGGFQVKLESGWLVMPNIDKQSRVDKICLIKARNL